LGLFNGMSPEVHPRALGRILSQIRFGSTLNTAASLAHPARPRRAVRGVYASHRLAPVTDLLQSIGFENGMVVHGHTADGADAMDEISILGPTSIVEFDAHSRRSYMLLPEDCGLTPGVLEDLRPHPDRNQEAVRFIRLLGGLDSPTRRDALLLNTAAILRVASPTLDWQVGIIQARKVIENGAALQKLIDWVKTQNRDPQSGMTRLLAIFQAADMPAHFNHSHRN
jgi:anthranilate phosphoribosyltransferase